MIAFNAIHISSLRLPFDIKNWHPSPAETSLPYAHTFAALNPTGAGTPMNNENDLPGQRDATQEKRRLLHESRERLQKYRLEIQERRRLLEEGPYSAALQGELKGLAIKIEEIQAEILNLQTEVAGHRTDSGDQRVLIDQPQSDLKNLTEDSQERKENVQTFREASQTLKEDNQKNNESTRDKKESKRN